MYTFKRETGTDTIRILIPSSRVRLVGDGETSATEPSKSEKSLSVAEVRKTESTAIQQPAMAEIPLKNEAVCKTIASDKDFIKLRRKMAAKETEDAMLDEARKEFRSRCYSVEQVRYLSSLFLTSASKYQFFDSAFRYVSDKSNFTSLSSELKDEHYTKRFKALIGE